MYKKATKIWGDEILKRVSPIRQCSMDGRTDRSMGKKAGTGGGLRD